jgi:hypothetical protein
VHLQTRKKVLPFMPYASEREIKKRFQSTCVRIAKNFGFENCKFGEDLGEDNRTARRESIC